MSSRSLIVTCLIFCFSFTIMAAFEPPTRLAGLTLQNGKYYKHYSEGPYSGRVYRHFSNGNKSFEISLHDGLLNGPWKIWHTNGKLKKKIHYKSGVLSGAYNIYYSSGNKFLHFNYVDGKMQKNVEGWYNNGNKWFVDTFNQGAIDGILKIWNKDGKLIHTIKIPTEGIKRLKTEAKNKDLAAIKKFRSEVIEVNKNL
jgi:antitoxin component YwqK of YwqJK toxin-antitoxin module